MEQAIQQHEATKSRASRSYRLAAYLMREVLSRDDFNSNIRGSEHIPKTDPYVAGYTHHASWWDVPLFAYALYQHDGTHIDIMGKRPLLKPYKPLGLFLRAAGGFGVTQGRLDVEALMEGYNRLQGGHKVGIALEGRGVKEKPLAKISSAMGLLMCAANVQTVPVAIAGEVEEHYIANRKITIVRKSLVQFGEPIPAPEKAGEFDLKDISHTGRLPLKLRKMSRTFVEDNLEPAIQTLYAETWEGYEELYGKAA